MICCGGRDRCSLRGPRDCAGSSILRRAGEGERQNLDEAGLRFRGGITDSRGTYGRPRGRCARLGTGGPESVRRWPGAPAVRSRRKPAGALGAATGRGSRARCSWRRARSTTTCVGAGAARLVDGLGLEQFGVGEDDPQLVVQPMEQQRAARAIPCTESLEASAGRDIITRRPAMPLGAATAAAPLGRLRAAPERVLEDADGAAGRADVLDLARPPSSCRSCVG